MNAEPTSIPATGPEATWPSEAARHATSDAARRLAQAGGAPEGSRYQGRADHWLQAALAEVELELALEGLEQTAGALRAAAAGWKPGQLIRPPQATAEHAHLALGQLEARTERVYQASGLAEMAHSIRLDRAELRLPRSGAAHDTGARSRHLIRSLVWREFTPGERQAIREICADARHQGLKVVSDAYAEIIGVGVMGAGTPRKRPAPKLSPQTIQSLRALLSAWRQPTGVHSPEAVAAARRALDELSGALPPAPRRAGAQPPRRWHTLLGAHLSGAHPLAQQATNLIRGLERAAPQAGPPSADTSQAERLRAVPAIAHRLKTDRPGGAWYRELNARRLGAGLRPYPSLGLNVSGAPDLAGPDLAEAGAPEEGGRELWTLLKMPTKETMRAALQDPAARAAWEALRTVTREVLSAPGRRSSEQALDEVGDWHLTILAEDELERALERLSETVQSLKALIAQSVLGQLGGAAPNLMSEFKRDFKRLERRSEQVYQISRLGERPGPARLDQTPPFGREARRRHLIRSLVWREFTPRERQALAGFNAASHSPPQPIYLSEGYFVLARPMRSDMTLLWNKWARGLKSEHLKLLEALLRAQQTGTAAEIRAARGQLRRARPFPRRLETLPAGAAPPDWRDTRETWGIEPSVARRLHELMRGDAPAQQAKGSQIRNVPGAEWYLELSARRVQGGLPPYPRLGLRLEKRL